MKDQLIAKIEMSCSIIQFLLKQLRYVMVFVGINEIVEYNKRMSGGKMMVQVDLKDQEVLELLKLEQLFHSHYMTEQLLNAMVGLYVRFVQNIHSNQHPLRIFFMEKIKFVLSRPEIIRILQKQSLQDTNNMRQTIRAAAFLKEEEENEMKRIAEEAKHEIRQNHYINLKKERGDATQELKEKERKMKIDMQMKIMEEVQNNMILIKNEFKKEGQQRKKKQEQINNMVQEQDNVLNERLARRKKKLRKKSVDLKCVEVIEIEAPPPIKKQTLIQMKAEVHQTFERFTRLTMNRTKRGTQRGTEHEGRVKVKIEESPIQQEDIYDQMQKMEQPKVEQPIVSMKKKKTNHQKPQGTKQLHLATDRAKQKGKGQVQKETKKATHQNGQTKRGLDNEKIETQNNKNEQKIQKLQSPKSKQDQVKGKQQQKRREVDSSIEYHPFDQSKGRVTVRVKQYQQIQEQEVF